MEFFNFVPYTAVASEDSKIRTGTDADQPLSGYDDLGVMPLRSSKISGMRQAPPEHPGAKNGKLGPIPKPIPSVVEVKSRRGSKPTPTVAVKRVDDHKRSLGKQQRRGPGRPPGSLNRPKTAEEKHARKIVKNIISRQRQINSRKAGSLQKVMPRKKESTQKRSTSSQRKVVSMVLTRSQTSASGGMRFLPRSSAVIRDIDRIPKRGRPPIKPDISVKRRRPESSRRRPSSKGDASSLREPQTVTTRKPQKLIQTRSRAKEASERGLRYTMERILKRAQAFVTPAAPLDEMLRENEVKTRNKRALERIGGNSENSSMTSSPSRASDSRKSPTRCNDISGRATGSRTTAGQVSEKIPDASRERRASTEQAVQRKPSPPSPCRRKPTGRDELRKRSPEKTDRIAKAALESVALCKIKKPDADSTKSENLKMLRSFRCSDVLFAKPANKADTSPKRPQSKSSVLPRRQGRSESPSCTRTSKHIESPRSPQKLRRGDGVKLKKDSTTTSMLPQRNVSVSRASPQEPERRATRERRPLQKKPSEESLKIPIPLKRSISTQTDEDDEEPPLKISARVQVKKEKGVETTQDCEKRKNQVSTQKSQTACVSVVSRLHHQKAASASDKPSDKIPASVKETCSSAVVELPVVQRKIIHTVMVKPAEKLSQIKQEPSETALKQPVTAERNETLTAAPALQSLPSTSAKKSEPLKKKEKKMVTTETFHNYAKKEGEKKKVTHVERKDPPRRLAVSQRRNPEPTAKTNVKPSSDRIEKDPLDSVLVKKEPETEASPGSRDARPKRNATEMTKLGIEASTGESSSSCSQAKSGKHKTTSGVASLHVTMATKRPEGNEMEAGVKRGRGRPIGTARPEKRRASKASETIPPVNVGRRISAPIFYPNEEQFREPLLYIEKVRAHAEPYGMCCIVPPSGWNPECKVNDEMRLTTQVQHIHRVFNSFGVSDQRLECIKRHLVSQGIDFGSHPLIGGIELDLPKFCDVVHKCGGMQEIIQKKKWTKVADFLGISKCAQDRVPKLYDAYCKYLVSYDTLSAEDKKALEGQVRNEQKKQATANQTSILKGNKTSLSNFFRMSRNTMNMYFRKSPSDAEIESEFWKTVSEGSRHVVVQAGIAVGTAFPTAKDSSYSRHAWNLNVLGHSVKSVLHSVAVPGVTVPELHIGMLFASQCWSMDPQMLPSIYYVHTGAKKVVYAIPPTHALKFEDVVKKKHPSAWHNKVPAVIPDTCMMPISVLVQNNVSVCRLVMEPGRFLVVFPGTYTASLCCGYSISEKINFARAEWLPLGYSVIKRMQDEEQPPSISIQQLVIQLALDTRTVLDALQYVCPILEEIRDNEVTYRKQLFSLGLKSSERLSLPTDYTPEGKRPRASRKQALDEEQQHCDVCRCIPYVSLVLNEQEQNYLCLKHAVPYIQLKKNLKSCRLFHRYDATELGEIIERVKEKIEQKKKLSKKKVMSLTSAGESSGGDTDNVQELSK